jgi:hypothetical protein
MLMMQAFESEVSGNVIDLCPVGAITSKAYSFQARPSLKLGQGSRGVASAASHVMSRRALSCSFTSVFHLQKVRRVERDCSTGDVTPLGSVVLSSPIPAWSGAWRTWDCKGEG